MHRPHRKRVRHFDIPGHAHELTFSCYRRFPLLDHDHVKAMLSTAIDRAIERHGFELVAFVYMPEHVHLIVFPIRSTATISALLAAIKRPMSFRVKQWMQERDDPWLGRLTIRERPGKTTFRFWQEGPGYDRNIDREDTLYSMIDYLHGNPVRRGLVASPKLWPWSSWHAYNQPSQPMPQLPTVHGLPDRVRSA